MKTLGLAKIKGLALVVGAMLMMLSLTSCGIEDWQFFFVTMKDPGVTADGVQYGREDILSGMEGDLTWFKVFDGSEYGLTPKHNIAAFSFNELLWYNLFTEPPDDLGDLETIPELFLTFTQSKIAVPGIATPVRGQDIVKFSEWVDEDEVEESEFELYFDGSDVGLTTLSEKIDGLGVWPPEYFEYWTDNDVEIPYDCNAGVIFITTQGSYRVPAATPGQSIVGKGSDVLLFCAFNLGADTSGLWYRVYNGEAEGIDPPSAGYSLDVLGFELFDVDEQAEDLDAGVLFLFTPRTAFMAPGLIEPGQPSELFIAESGSSVGGPILDYNDDIDSVNGIVDGISLFDFPFETVSP